MSNIPINSGTGPGVAVDLIGTDNYQVVKIMQAASGSTGSLSTTLSVSGNLSITNTPTITVANTVTITGTVGSLMLQRLDNTNDSILVYGLQTGSALPVPVALSTSGYQYTIGGLQPTRFQTFVLATTSAAGGVIVKTSGANTVIVTDLLVSVAGPMTVQLASETTAMTGTIFLGSQGGFVMNYIQPLVCTTAQSLRVLLSSSGSCSVSVVGYTVT